MDKKELKQNYKLNPPTKGIYQIRNLVNEKGISKGNSGGMKVAGTAAYVLYSM